MSYLSNISTGIIPTTMPHSSLTWETSLASSWPLTWPNPSCLLNSFWASCLQLAKIYFHSVTRCTSYQCYSVYMFTILATLILNILVSNRLALFCCSTSWHHWAQPSLSITHKTSKRTWTASSRSGRPWCSSHLSMRCLNAVSHQICDGVCVVNVRCHVLCLRSEMLVSSDGALHA